MEKYVLLLSIIGAFTQLSKADDFPALQTNVAVVQRAHVDEVSPVFDFDGDCCLPSALFRENPLTVNGGLDTSGGDTDGCRQENFLELSNTYHRLACREAFSSLFCVDVFLLYFLKDQTGVFGLGGHRHDLEFVAVWSINNNIRFISMSTEDDTDTVENVDNNIAFQNGSPKIVYHQEGTSERGFRVAGQDEDAEASDEFVLPNVVSYFLLNNSTKSLFRTTEFIDAFEETPFVLTDANFVPKLNSIKPAGFPNFREEDQDNLIFSINPAGRKEFSFTAFSLVAAIFAYMTL